MAPRMFSLSLTIWILILTAELSTLLVLGDQFFKTGSLELKSIWMGLFSWVLLARCFAVVSGWLGVAVYGWNLKTVERFPKWFSSWAVYGGLFGIAGVLITF
ncbi:MAG: hypothetical protein IMW92_10650 [Bacillales bacterium]|nr:hypothetical protein [Bacillales bacterium]